MRVFALAVVALQIGLAPPGLADNPPGFVKTHCEEVRVPADQLFCGDPELNAIGPKLSSAIAQRLSRLPNHSLAIEDNAEWIRDRNSSCGIPGRQPIKRTEIKPVRDCLLLETKERIEILTDPNFDCLAAKTAAGSMICSDPVLALARAELNAQ